MSFPAIIELSDIAGGDGSLGFVINGIDVGDWAGRSVASAGDVNGDGIDDVIIGASAADPGGRDTAGESYVVFGSENGFAATLELSALDGGNGFVISGIDPFDQSGISVASAGDLNGDGIDDLIIGARASDPGGRSGAGESYIVFGSADGFGATLELSSLDGSNGFTINGIDFGDQSGSSVASAGDVNGDGIDDLIIGALSADPGGRIDAGESYVVFGSAAGFAASLDLSNLDGSNGFTINGIDVADHSGISVASAGDVNGDGICDLVIGAQLADPGGRTDAGESYIVFGSADGFGATLELSSLDGSNGFTINGIDAGDRNGFSVASAGDVNGDGIDDLIIGAATADTGGGIDAGESYVVFGSAGGFNGALELSALDGTNGFAINGIDAADVSGLSVAGAGDVNGDGFDDLIIGAYLADPGGRTSAGESYVVFGSAGGFGAALDLSALDGNNGFVLNGVVADDESGFSVAGAGDVNGDGYDDLIVGAYRADPGGRTQAGEAYVIYGRASGQTEGTSGNDRLEGAGGQDTLNGYEGDDYLFGGYFADTLTGGAGNDFYDAVTFADTIVELENEGTDLVRTRVDNYVLGDNLENLYLFGSVAQTGTGNALDNYIVGTGGANALYGLGGNDRLSGQTGADSLFGGTGDDSLYGGARNDSLDGGDGVDYLSGGTGRDALGGGAEADVFQFYVEDFAGLGPNSADRILDFSQTEGDTINLRGVDAISGNAGHDAFAFIGGARFSGAAGELRYVQRDGGFTMVQGDTDGDGLADFAIRLDGLVDLTAGDFVL